MLSSTKITFVQLEMRIIHRQLLHLQLTQHFPSADYSVYDQGGV